MHCASILILGTCLLGPAAHAGQADSTRFSVEFIDAPEDAAATRELDQQIEVALREHVEQTTVPASSDKQLFVYISDMPSAPGEDFLVRLVAVAYEREVGSTEPLACVACGAEELAGTAIDMLPPMLEVLATAEPPPAAPPPEPVQAEADHVPEPPPPSDWKPRALRITGTTTAATGALVLGSGAALLAVGKVYPRDANGLVIDVIDYRPPGAILAGVGGAMLVAGLVCFGLGSRTRSGLVGAVPVMDRYSVGGSVAFAF